MLCNVVIFGPDDTPWDGGTFKFTLQFSEDYPNKPPTVRFVSWMFHPIVMGRSSTNDNLQSLQKDSLLDQRRRSADIEADFSMKLADMEKQFNECSSSLSRHKEMVRELEPKVESLHQELCSVRDDASASEQQYLAEISTISKLADLYKESSEEWSKNSGKLEGVIKALETHLSQVESDYKDKLEKETAARKEAEKVSVELKEKLVKCEAELEASRRANELDIIPLSSFTTEALMYTSNTNNIAGDNLAMVPHIPAGINQSYCLFYSHKSRNTF